MPVSSLLESNAVLFGPDNVDLREAMNAVDLAIGSLEQREFELPLEQTRVVAGAQEGKRGDLYVSGRVDKACLELTSKSIEGPAARPAVEIGLVAEIVEPYAVIVQ